MQRKANFLVSVLPLTMRLELKTIVYLDSIFFSLCNVDDEVQSRIRLASFIFGRLLHHNTSSTEIAVYRAVYITPPPPPPLLYDSEAWPMYRAQFKSLEAFSTHCLQRILGFTWADRVPQITNLQSADCLSVEAQITQRVGHVHRLDEGRLPFLGQTINALSAERSAFKTIWKQPSNHVLFYNPRYCEELRGSACLYPKRAPQIVYR